MSITDNLLDMIADYRAKTNASGPARIVLGHSDHGRALLTEMALDGTPFRAVDENGVDLEYAILNGVKVCWPVEGSYMANIDLKRRKA